MTLLGSRKRIPPTPTFCGCEGEIRLEPAPAGFRRFQSETQPSRTGVRYRAPQDLFPVFPALFHGKIERKLRLSECCS